MKGILNHCCGLTRQAAKHHTAVRSLPYRVMGERIGKKVKLVG